MSREIKNRTPKDEGMKDSADAMPTFYDIDSHTPEVSGSDTSKTEAPSFDMSFSPLNSLQKVTRFYYLVWAVIGCILLALGAWYLLKQMTTALAVICFAALLVFLLRSPVDWMEAKGIPRWAGALIAYFVGLTGVTLIGLIVIPILMKQLVDLISQVPAYIGNLEDVYEHFIERYGYILEDSNINQIVHSLGETVTTWAISFVSSAPGGAISIGTNLINAALVFLISLVAGYWVLKDLPTIKLEAKALIKPSHRDDLSFVALAFSRALGGYLRGMLIAGTCVSIFTFIGFSILKMPYSALLALIAGLMMFIPILGPWISGVTVVSIGLFVSPLTAFLAVLIVIVAVQLTDYLITPRVMSSAVELHPAIILVGVLAGGALAGVPGLIVAIPLLAATKSIFVYFFEKNSDRRISHKEGAFFRKAQKNGEKPTKKPTMSNTVFPDTSLDEKSDS